MKKFILIIVVCSFCTILTACSKVKEGSSGNLFAELEFVRVGETDRVGFNDLKSLEESVDLAVVGEFVADAEQDIFYDYDGYLGKNIVTNVVSYNTIEVTRVLKGDVNVGDNLKIGQYYGIVDGDLITFSDLTPMQKGDEWVFFLRKQRDADIYWCYGDSDARYPTKKSVNNEPMPFSDSPDLGVYDNENFNRDIYNEILEKYDI